MPRLHLFSHFEQRPLYSKMGFNETLQVIHVMGTGLSFECVTHSEKTGEEGHVVWGLKDLEYSNI